MNDKYMMQKTGFVRDYIAEQCQFAEGCGGQFIMFPTYSTRLRVGDSGADLTKP